MTAHNILMSAAGASGPSFWMSTIGSSNYDIPQDVVNGLATDFNGNVYICTNGETSSGNKSIYVAKLNAEGVMQWQRYIDSGGTADYAWGLCLDSSLNVYVYGAMQEPASSYGIFVAKYNSSGVLQWKYKFTTADGGDAYAGACDSSGNLIIAGSQSISAGNNRPFVLKLNPSGTILFQKYYSDASITFGDVISLGLDGSGNIYIAGRYNTSSLSVGHLTKLNSSGTVLWSRRSGAFTYYSVVSSAGDVYISTITSPRTGAILVKYNTNGVIQWQRACPIIDNNSTYEYLGLDSGGNVYAVSMVYSSGRIVVINKYSSAGALIWQRTISGGELYTYNILLANGAYYLIGDQYSTTLGNNDIFLSKLPDDGSLTGEYGGYTYATASYADSAGTATDASLSLVDTNLSLTATVPTVTEGAATLKSQALYTQSNYAPPSYWINYLVGPSDTKFLSSATDISTNDIYAVGYGLASPGGTRGIVAKYTASGNLTWSKALRHPTGSLYLYTVKLDSSGGVYVLAYISGVTDPCCLLKFNSSGVIQWQRALATVRPQKMDVSPTGDCYIVGTTSGNTGFALVKYNSSGTIQWQKTSSSMNGYGVAFDAINNILATVGSVGSASRVPWAGTFTTSGTIVDQRTHTPTSGTFTEYKDVAYDEYGYAHACGYTDVGVPTAGSYEVLVTNLGSFLTVNGAGRLGTVSSDTAYSIATFWNNTLVTGYVGGDGILWCTSDFSASSVYQRSLSASGPQEFNSVTLDYVGNAVLAGVSSYVATLIKLPVNGSLTGTYSGFSYAASSFPTGNAPFSAAPVTSYTVSDSAYVDSAGVIYEVTDYSSSPSRVVIQGV